MQVGSVRQEEISLTRLRPKEPLSGRSLGGLQLWIQLAQKVSPVFPSWSLLRIPIEVPFYTFGMVPETASKCNNVYTVCSWFFSMSKASIKHRILQNSLELMATQVFICGPHVFLDQLGETASCFSCFEWPVDTSLLLWLHRPWTRAQDAGGSIAWRPEMGDLPIGRPRLWGYRWSRCDTGLGATFFGWLSSTCPIRRINESPRRVLLISWFWDVLGRTLSVACTIEYPKPPTSMKWTTPPLEESRLPICRLFATSVEGTGKHTNHPESGTSFLNGFGGEYVLPRASLEPKGYLQDDPEPSKKGLVLMFISPYY